MRLANPFGMGLAALLLAGALAVRSLPPRAAGPPEAAPDQPTVLEPLQLLRAGGEPRIGELDALIDLERRDEFVTARLDLLELSGCPAVSEWLRTRKGLALERALSSLQRGSRVEALAASALLFQLARSTSWRPGVFGDSGGAERLGGLWQRWIEDWGERGARDDLLHEPALLAVLAYGRVMHAASEGNLFRASPASRERARGFLRRAAGAQGERRTALGLALAARYPEALAALERDGDLSGLAREADLLLAGLDGECGQ